MKKNLDVYLKDIVTSCQKIEEYIKDSGKEEFLQNIQIQDAVIRRLEIIGEAVKHIPEIFRKKYSNIEWRKAAGMRDILIHMYDEVDYEQVWKTIKETLPLFKKQIENLDK